MIRLGAAISARPIASICCWPPESAPPESRALLPQHLEQVVRPARAARARSAARRRAAAELEVLLDAQVGEDPPSLHAVRDAQPYHLVRLAAVDPLAAEADLARRSPEHAAEAARGRGLSGAVGAEQRHHLARAALEVTSCSARKARSGSDRRAPRAAGARRRRAGARPRGGRRADAAGAEVHGRDLVGSASTSSGAPSISFLPQSSTTSRSEHSRITSITCSTTRIASTSARSGWISSISSMQLRLDQPGADLVQKEQPRAQRQRPRQLEPLQPQQARSPAGTSANPPRPLGSRIARQSRAPSRLRARAVAPAQQQVLEHLRPGERPRDLVGAPDAEPGARAGAPGRSRARRRGRPPLLAGIAPESRPIRVLLPAPFGPMTPSVSPERSSRSSESTASTPP